MFYLDTSIWLDIYEKRGKNGRIALEFLLKIMQDRKTIAYSDLNRKELKLLGYTEQQILDMFNIAKPYLRKLNIHRDQLVEMNKVAKARNVPRKDVLHAILSRDNDAQLITRDKHFNKLKDITEAQRPEDVT